jgi:putative endonuclease
VARLGSTLVFCEVKTRSATAYGQPFEAVTVIKQRRLRRLAAEWLRRDRPPGGRFEVRFDVASVRSGVVEIIEGAF